MISYGLIFRQKSNFVPPAWKLDNPFYHKVHVKTLHLVDGEDTLPFHCDICDKSFLKNSYFEEHQNRFHADIKPFPCMYCPKRCATKQDLDRHLTSHRGESIYQCAFCSRGFVHRASLTRWFIKWYCHLVGIPVWYLRSMGHLPP